MPIRTTSIETYRNEQLPKLGDREEWLMEEIRRRGPMTNMEAARYFDWTVNATPVVAWKLVKLGLLKAGAKRRCEVTGRRCIQWEIATPEPVTVPSVSMPERPHQVVCVAGEFRCDCKGFFYRASCSHVSAAIAAQMPKQQVALAL